MVYSWFRKWVSRKSQAPTARDRRSRPKGRRLPLSIERLEERLVLDSTATNTGQLFNFSSNNNTGTLYLREDFPSQYIQYSTDNSTWSNLQSIAGTGTISITPTSLKSVVTGSVVPGDFQIVSSINTNGRGLDISAEGSIWVKPNVVLTAGSLTLDVENPRGAVVSSVTPHITIDTSASLQATGDVTLKVIASQISLNVPILTNFGVDNQTASIDVNSGASISGANVTISATAGDVNPLNAVNQDLNDQNGAVSGLLKSFLTYATDYFGLPLSIQFKSPSAEVTLNSTASITSTGAATITSEADADATGEAIFSADTQAGFGGAFGFNWSSPTATTTVQSNASIAAGGLVSVQSTVKSTAVGTARVTQNAGPGFLKNQTVAPYSQVFTDKSPDSLSGPFVTDPNRIQVAGDVVIQKLTSITTVQKDASITSSDNVVVQALGTYVGSANADTSSYWDGRAGIGFAVGYTTSTIQAIVDGKITVNGSRPGGAKDIINPFKAVNFAQSTIHFDTADGFQTGDALTYSSGDGTAIPGLESGSTYYVIVVDPQTIRLADSPSDAQNGTYLTFGTFPTLTDGTLSVPITSVNDITNTIEFGYDTGIKAGDHVTYSAVAGQAIGGLVDGQTYTVVAGGDSANPFAFQLKNASGNLVQFHIRPTLTTNGGTALDFNVGTDPNTIDLRGQTFTPVIDTASNTIDLGYSHGFTAGEHIIYDNGGGTSIGIRNADGSLGILTQGGEYVAVVDPSHPTELGLKDLSGHRITLVDPGSTSLGDEHRFTALAATQVQTGDALTYHAVLGLNLTGLTDGTTYYAITNPYNPGVLYLAASQADAIAAGNAGQQAHDSAVTTFLQGVHDDAVQDYLNNIKPGSTDQQAANTYADGIVANDGNAILQVYLSQEPGRESLWFATGAAAARNTGGTPIVLRFTADLTIMSGVLHSLTQGATGITINAQLRGTDSGLVRTGLGGEPLIAEALTQGELAPALPGIFKGVTGGNSFTQNNIVKNLPVTEAGNPIQPDGPDFSVSGAFAVLYVNNNVLADVGQDAVLKTTQTITVTSSISDKTSIYVDAQISKPDDGTQASTTPKSIAAGVGVGIFNNSAVTKIEDGAHLDASGAITATSSVFYPFKFPTSASAAAQTFGQNIIGDVSSFLYGKLGLDAFLFNSWVHTNVQAAQGDVSIAGSIAVNVYTNVTQTLVGSAFINQDPAYRNPNVAQTVAFDAHTTIDSVNQTGVFALNLTPEAISKLKEIGTSILGGAGSGAQKGSAGGSLYVMVVNNTTTTKVGSGAQIYTALPAANRTTFTPTLSGNTLDLGYDHGFTTGEPIFYDNTGADSTDIGGLQRGHVYYAIVDPSQPTKLRLAASSADATAIVPVAVNLTSAGSGSGHSFTRAALSVTAETTNIEVSLAAAGSSAAVYGVAGTFSVLVFTNHTTAQVDAGAQISGPMSGGDLHGLNIDAYDTTDLINLAGSVTTGSRRGFGFTATVNVLDRTTLALLGANPTDSSDALAASAVNLGGDLGINAQNAGVLVGASFAASVNATPEELGNTQPAGGSPFSSEDVLLLEAQRMAGFKLHPVILDALDAVGKYSPSNSVRDQLARLAGVQTGLGVAGDASLNLVVHDTADAFVNEKPAVATADNPGAANIVAANVTVTADNQTVVAALAGAVAVSVDVESDGNKGLAGSFTVNTLIGETKAYISGAVIQDSGALTVLATRGGYIGSLTAGAAAAPGVDSTGVEGSISVNVITDQVAAYLTGDTVTLADDLQVKAKDSSLIVSVAGGVGFGGSAGVGLAIAANVVTNTTTAYLESSTVTQSGGGLDVQASNENPTTNARIVALTGTVGASTGNGVAVMIGVNVIADTTDAHLKDTTYTNTNANSATNGASVQAIDKSWIISLGLAIGAGKDTSVGGAFSGNAIANPVSAHLDNTTFTSKGSLKVHAESADTIGAGTVGVAGSADGNGVAGSFSVNLIDNTTNAYITANAGDTNPSQVTAGGPIEVSATDQSLIVSVAGGVGISFGGSAAGGAFSGNAVSNQTHAYINDATVHATGKGSSLTVSANENSTIVAISVGAAVGDGNSGSGSITVNVIDNETTAYIQNAPADVTGNPAIEAGGSIAVTATDSSTIIVVSGAITGSTGGSAFGGSLSVNLMLNHTDAYIDGSAVKADSGGVLVSAGWVAAGSLPTSFTLGNPSDDGSSFSVQLPAIPDQVKGSIVNVSVSGTAGNWNAVAGAVPINYIANEVKAYITGSSVTVSGDVQVLAADRSTIGSGALGLAVGNNAGGATIGTSDILNHVYAYIENSTITTTGTGGVAVAASEEAKTVTIAFGVAAAGRFALGGSVGVNVTSNVVDAHISKGSVVQSAGTVEVKATDTTSVFAGTGGLAAGGTAAAGAALATNKIADTVTAYIDSSTVSASAGDVRVEAASTPTVDAGTVGGAASLEVAVAGSITVSIIDDTTQAYISGATTQVTADGNVVVSAFQDLHVGTGSGGFSGAGSAAVGLANSTVTTDDVTEAYIGTGVTAIGRGNGAAYQAYTGKKDSSGAPITEDFHGVSVTSVSFQDVLSLAVGGAGGGTAGIAGSATVEVLNETSKAHVDAGAQINVDTTTPNPNQGVNIHATNYTRVLSGAGAVGGGGTVGVGAGIDVGVIIKHTEAYIADASSKTQSFGSTAVDTSADTIDLGSNHGFTTGQPVLYNNGGGPGIGINGGTLNSGGAVYYVIVVDAQKIKLAASRSDALSGTAINLTSTGTSASQSVRALNTGLSGPAFGSSSVVTSGQANSITVTLPSDFTNGQPVVYSNGAGTDIGGLANGHLYYAIYNPSNPNQLQLAASPNGSAIALTSHGTSSSQSVQEATLGTPSSFGPSAIVPDSAANTINLSFGGSSLSTGTPVVYDHGGGTDIGGLTNGQIYYAIVDPNNSNVIRLAATAADAAAGKAITLTSTNSSIALQAFHPVTPGTSATFGPSSVTYYSGGANDNSIALGPTNPFHTGDTVVYNNGGGADAGGLVNGHVYYAIVDPANPDLLRLADSSANATAGTALALFSPGSSSTQTFQAVSIASPGANFLPSGVTPAAIANAVNLGTANPFHSGDALVYKNGGGASVGGLVSGQVYYAIIDPANPGLVKLAATPGDVALGKAISLTSGGNTAQTFTPLTLGSADSFDPSAVINAADVNAITTAAPVGFTNGQAVVYDAGGGSAIGGLKNGQIYYAVVDASHPTRFQLAATSGGTPITLTSAGSSSQQQFTAVNLPAAGTTSTAAVVHASGDVDVRADSQENVVSVAAAGAGGGTVAFGASIGSYTLIINTLADIGSGATVLAQGNVHVAADDVDAVNMLAGTVTGAGSAAIGASIGVPVIIKNTNAYIGADTTVDGLGTRDAFDANTGTYTETFAPSSFNPTTNVTVDTSANEIDLGYNPGFTTGDEVVYDNGGGGTIGGLTSGQVYFVIVDATNHNKIKLAASKSDALAGTAITLTSTGGHFQQSFRKVVPNTHTFNAANNVLPGSSANSIKMDATNLNTGDAVIYHNGGGTSIAGLIDGHTYYVIKKSSSQIQLAATQADASAGNAIALGSTGTSSSQSLTPTPASGTSPEIFFGRSDVTQSTLADSIDLGYAHGFSTGQALVYHDGGGTDIGGLTSGQVYYAIVDPSQPNRIKLAATPDDATAGNAIALTPGSGSSQSFAAVADAQRTFDPAATASASANTIDLGYSHGFSTGQAVDYSNGGGSDIGGLTSGNTYYAVVDPNHPTKLRLAATKDDALAGNVLLLTTKGTGSSHTINPHGFASPSINNPSVTEPGLFSRRLATADTTPMKGVAVTATSSDDIEQMIIAGSGASTAAIPLSASIHVLNNHTNAYIDSGAQVNTNDQADAGSGQSVLVAAGSDYYHLGVAGAAGVAGVAAVGAGVDVSVVTLHTLAYIDGGATVNAQNDVSVLARSKERVLSIGVGLSLAGTAGLGGSVSVPVVNTTTLAFIGNQDQSSSTTVVHAGNNVQVAASDETHALTVDGGVGVGLAGGGVGVSVPVVVFTKDTEAYISNGGDVRGLANGTDLMPVLEGTVPAIPQTFDASSSNVVNTTDNSINLSYDPGFGTGEAVVYDNGGGGNIGGLTSGTTYYAIVDPTTPKKLKLAKTRQDALAGHAINLSTGSGANQTIKSAGNFRTKTAKGVAVQATSSEDVLTVAVAGGAGLFVGLAGSVAVTVIHATTRAFIGAAVINDPTGVSPGAAQDVSVGAADFSRIHTVVPSVSAGFVGLGGAINVGDVNNDTRAYIGSGANVHAQGNVDVFALSNKDFDSTTISIAVGGVAISGAVAVFTLGAALDSSSQQALQDPNNSSSNAGSSTSNLQQVSDAINSLGGTNGDSNSSTQVSTNGSQQTSGNSSLVTNNLNNTINSVSTTSTESNTAADTLNSTTAPENGTVAYIGGTSQSAHTHITAGGDISVQAKEAITANLRVGQGSGGAIGVGAAVAVLTIHSNTQAFIDSDAVVAAAGNITVNASLKDQTSVNLFAGQGGTVLGIGAEVAINNDTSNQLAYVADGARIDQASAITVTAEAGRTISSSAGGITGGLVAAGGAAALATAGGTTVAAVGAGAKIGQTAGESVGSLTVSASNQSSVTTTGLIVTAGAYAAGGDEIEGTVNPDVQAYIGQGAKVTVTGAVDVSATSTPFVNVVNNGGGGGGISISALVTSATIGGKTWAFIDKGANVTAGSLSVTASTPSRSATATSFVVNIGLGSGNGSNTTAEVGGSVEAFVGQQGSTVATTLAITGEVLIHAESVSNPVANSTLGSGGVVAVSASVSDAKADGTTSAFVGDKTTIGTSFQPVNSLQVTAQGTDVASDTAVLGSGGLGTGRGSDTEAHVKPTISTSLGQNVTANVAHNLEVVATSTSAEGHATANSYGGGGADVGAPTTTVVTAPTVLSSIGAGSTLTVGGDLTVKALAHADKSPAQTLTDFIQGVDTTKDTINFIDYGLQNGDPVTYQPGSGTPIQTPTGNMQQYVTNPDGTQVVRTYHVLQVVTTDSQGKQTIDPNNLRLGDTFNGGPVNAGDPFATGSGVDATRNEIRFASAHGFVTGDAVHYLAGSGSTSLSALNTTTNTYVPLNTTTTYYVRKIDDFTIKLYTNRDDAIAAAATFTGSAIDPVNNTITLSGFQDGEAVSYQAPPPVQFLTTVVNAKPELSNGNLTGNVIADPGGNEIAVGTNDYQTGDALIYRTSDPNNPIGGLTDGTTYYVIKDPNNPYVIQLAADPEDCVTRTDAAGHTVQPKPITLSVSTNAANAKHYLVRPTIAGLTSGVTYKLSLVSGTSNTYHLKDSGGNVVKIAAAGWSFLGTAGVAGNGSGFTSTNPSAPEGTQVAFLQQTGSASQPLTFPAGTYKISFSAAQRKGQASTQTFNVLVDGNLVGTFTPSSTDYGTYTTNAFQVTAGTHVITFVGTNPNGGDNTAFIDQLSVSSTSSSSPAAPNFADPGFELPIVGTGTFSAFQYNPAGMSGTHQLFKDGMTLKAGSGTQELHLVLTSAASPVGSDKLLGVGGVSLRSLAPTVNATGQSTASTTALGGGLAEFAFPTSNLTTTPTVKAWASPALATVGGSVTIASESVANTLASAYLEGGGIIAGQEADATTNFGTSATTPAVNEAFVGIEDTSGNVSGSGVNIHAAQGFTLSSVTNLTTNPTATANGGGLGAGVSAKATANVNNTTTTTVGGGADVSGQTVTILADVQNLGLTLSSTGNAFGLIAIPHAESNSNVASTAKVLIGGGTTQITGLGGVDIQARHDTFNPSLFSYASWNTIETPHEEHRNNNNTLSSPLEADAGATVVAGPPAGSTTALNVFAGTIQWDANVTVAAGPSPYLLVNSDGTIAKAVAITVDDSAAGGSSALTSGQIKSSTVVVNTVNNPGSEVKFSASGGITNSATNPYPLFTFTDTLQGVTIINHSAKTLQIGNIDVANRGGTTAPEVLLTSSTSGNFEFDIQHTVAPTLIDIEQDATTAEDINLTGTIENPIGTTTIRDKNGNIHNTSGSTQVIRTNILDVEASGSVGSSTNWINAELVQSTDTSTNTLRTPQLTAEATSGDTYLNLRARNRSTGTDPLTVYAPTVSAGGNVNLQLQSSVVDSGTGGTTGTVHVEDSPDGSLTGDYAAHFHDASQTGNATLDQGVYAGTTNDTTTPSTYDFTGTAGLSAGGNISVQAANSGASDPTIDIIGTTSLQPNTTNPNHIDVTTNGKIDLTQVGGPLRVGTIHSTNADVTLSVPETSAQVEGLVMPNASSITAWGNVLLQVGANVDLEAGSTITAQGGNAATPKGTVTIQGDYENGAAISPDPGTTINLFGSIYGTSAKVYGYDDGDVFNIGKVVSSTPMTVTASGKNNTFNVGSKAPASGGIVDNIQGALTIVGDSGGTATLNVDDTGSKSAKTDGALTSTQLTGLNMGASGITYSNLANLNINLGSGGNTFLIKNTAAKTSTALNSGRGADTVNVQTTAGPTAVNTGGGSNANTVNVGSTAPATAGIVDNIKGALTVTGNGADTMNVDDTGSTGVKSGTLTESTLTGLKMGPSGITYSGLSTLNISLGAGGSTGNSFNINVASGQNLPATSNLNGGSSGLDTLDAKWGTDFNGTLNVLHFAKSTVTVGTDFNGTMTDKDPGFISSIAIGGSLTASGKLFVVSTSDPANLTTPTGLLGNIGTMTVGGAVAGSVQVSGNLGTLTVGKANTATTGGVNDVSGQIVVGGQLTTASISGNVSGLVQEDLTINSLYIGGSITSTGVIKAVNPADPAAPKSTQGLLGNINTMTVGGAVAGSVLVSGNLGTLTVGKANTATTGGVNDVSGQIVVGGQLTTASISGNVSGLVQEDLTINTVYIGGSVTSTGVIKAVNPADQAAPKSTQGLLGNINTLTVGGAVAGLVQVSGNLGTLTVGKANTATTGGVNDVSGQIVVGGQLTTASISGNVSGLVQEDLTVNTLYIGGSITSTGVVKAVNPADPAMPTTTQGLLGNINTLTIGGAVAGLVQVSGNLTTLTVGTPNTPTTGGVNDVSGKIIVGGQLTTGSISGNVSGLVQEDLTINTLYIGGSLTSTGVIQAVNTTTPSLGNINTLTIGQNLAGRVIVSGTINNLAIVNGSMTPTGLIQVANLNTMTIGPARLSVGQDMAGQILVSGNFGSLRVAGGTPGSITAGHIGTVSVYGGFGPVVLQITENGTQRRVEEATPANPYPLPDSSIQAATSPYATAGTGGVPSYINIQYVYESATPVVSNGKVTLTNPLANPQWTARITNNVSTAADQYDISLVTYNDKAKFNLARLDAAGVAGVRNVAVEGDVLKAVSSQAASFFQVPGAKGTTVADSTPAGVRLPSDKLAGVAVRDYLPAGYIQAKSIQALAFGSYTTSKGSIVTGSTANNSAAAALLVSGTAIVQANDTFRVPFADLATQQVGLFLATLAGGFSNSEVVLVVQGVPTPNAGGTANIVTPSNVARGAVTALVSAVPTLVSGKLTSVIQTIALRGDGGSIQTQQYIAVGITSTGPLGDLQLLNSQGVTDVTAPSIFGSILDTGPITGTVQTTGVRTDPITSVVTQVPADLGNVYVASGSHGPFLTVTTVQSSPALTGRIISRGRLLSQVQVSGGMSGLVAAQGDIGTVVGSTRLGGVIVGGGLSGQIVTLGTAYGDVQVGGGGAVGGQIAAKGGFVGNLTINGTVDAASAIISGGEMGDAGVGTHLTVTGTNYGIIAAEGPTNLGKAVNTATGGYYQANMASGNASKAAIDAVFSYNNGQPLGFDLAGLDLGGLALIMADLKALKVGSNGYLTGPVA
jgi:hypothetical protein